MRENVRFYLAPLAEQRNQSSSMYSLSPNTFCIFKIPSSLLGQSVPLDSITEGLRNDLNDPAEQITAHSMIMKPILNILTNTTLA